jgi:hypothetical protein
MGTQTLVFRISMYNNVYLLNYKYAKDIHLITYLLIQGKGACLTFFGAVYRKHKGGIYSGATDYTNAELSYLCYKEIYNNNKQIHYLKLKYIRFTQFYIDQLMENNEFKSALLKSMEIFKINASMKPLLKNMVYIVKRLLGSI